MAKKKTTTKKTSKKATPTPAAKPTAATAKHPGIISFMVECLKKQPHSKTELLTKLVKQFPDRQAEGMQRTIHCQLPSRLSKKYKVSRDGEGRFAIK